MAVRYRLSSVLWTIALLATALGWFCDRRQLEARHDLEMQQVEERHALERQEQWTKAYELSSQLVRAVEREHQLAELLRETDGPAIRD